MTRTEQDAQARNSGTTSTPFWRLLPELYRVISPQRRRQLYLLLVLMMLGAIAELATLGSLLPFLSLLAGGDLPSRLPFEHLFRFFGAATPNQQAMAAAVLFGAI